MRRPSWYQRLVLAVLSLLAALRREKPPGGGPGAVSARHIISQPQDEPEPPAVHPKGELKR